MRQRLGIAGGAAARPAAAAARRADDRPGPGRHARHARARATARRRGHHRAALQPPDGRGRGAVRPRGDRPPRPRDLRGRARRAARDAAGALRAAHHRRRARRAGRARASRASATCVATPDGAAPARRRGGGRGARRSRSRRRASASARSCRARRRSRSCSSALTEGERVERPRPAARERRARTRRGADAAASLTVYRWELRKLRAQKRTYIGLGAAVARPADLHRRAARLQSGGPERHPVRPLRARVRPGHPARPAALRLDLAVPAGHLARGRRHRRRRGPQRHAEDDPHPLGRPLADLRRQGRSRRSPTRSPRCCSSRVVARSSAARSSGLQPAHYPVGHAVSVGRGLAAGRRQPRATSMPMLAIAAIALLLSTVTRNSAAAVVGTLMISLIMQLLGIISRRSASCSPTCSRRSSTPGRACCASRSTGRRSRAALGVGGLRGRALAAALLVFLRRDVAGG